MIGSSGSSSRIDIGRRIRCITVIVRTGIVTRSIVSWWTTRNTRLQHLGIRQCTNSTTYDSGGDEWLRIPICGRQLGFFHERLYERLDLDRHFGLIDGICNNSQTTIHIVLHRAIAGLMCILLVRDRIGIDLMMVWMKIVLRIRSFVIIDGRVWLLYRYGCGWLLCRCLRCWRRGSRRCWISRGKSYRKGIGVEIMGCPTGKLRMIPVPLLFTRICFPRFQLRVDVIVLGVRMYLVRVRNRRCCWLRCSWSL